MSITQTSISGMAQNMANVNTSVNKDVVAWYVLKVLWRQETITEQRLQEEGFETYIPRRQILKEDKRKRKQRVVVPAINSLLFVHSSIRQLEKAKEMLRVNFGQTIYFYTNREGLRNVITSIPDSQMRVFRNACDTAGDAVRYYLPEELELAKGTRVRILGGPFEGFEGVLLKLKGKRSKSLVVSIDGFISAAVAEVSSEYVQVIETKKASD